MTPFDLTDSVVVLSVPTEADIGRITELCQDEEVARWTTVPSPYQRSDAEWFVRELVANGWAEASTGTWAVRTPDDPRVHGMVGVDLGGDGELGFWMGAHARGRGWTTRAARLAIDAAFAHGVDHVRWKAIIGNDASRRVAEGLGFTMDGTVRRLIEARGQWHDGWIATLLADERR